LTRRRRREILSELEPLGVHVQTVPEFEQLVTGNATLGDIREVDVCDLLGRDSVPPKAGLFDACIRDRVVMVTGAGGSIGSELCRQIIGLGPKRLVLFEMSELALYNIQRELRAFADQHSLTVELIGLIGNAHHKFRLRDILQAYRVQTVYHAAAYKHVPIVEQNVIEGIHNNVISTWYAAEAAHETEVETFVLVSTDKAVNPINLYGATKLCAEKMFVQANAYAGSKDARFACARYGNVVGSRGSVIPVFLEQRKTGKITITDPRMTRFWITLDQGVKFVIRCIEEMHGGEIFVPKIPSMRMADLAETIAPGCEIEVIGIRPGEKLHEVLVSEDEARNTVEVEGMYVIRPSHPWWSGENWVNGCALPEGFRYTSDTNSSWMTNDQLQELISQAKAPVAA